MFHIVDSIIASRTEHIITWAGPKIKNRIKKLLKERDGKNVDMSWVDALPSHPVPNVLN